MTLASIEYKINNNQLGRELPNRDHVSGYCYWAANAPSGFSGADDVKKFVSFGEAEDAGFIEDDADTGIAWYHIREFFRENPRGELWVNYAGTGAAFTVTKFSSIETLQQKAGGRIRQMAVDGYWISWDDVTSDLVAQVNSLQTSVDKMRNGTGGNVANTDCQIIYNCNWSTMDGGAGKIFPTDLPDLKTAAAPDVSVSLGQDGSGKGYYIVTTGGATSTIGMIGKILGMVSRSKVSHSISWIDRYRVDNYSTEFATPHFQYDTDGVPVSDYTKAQLDTVSGLGYIFALPGYYYDAELAGVYLSGSPTCVADTSDFSTIENGRTMKKFIRNSKTNLTPYLNSPLQVDADGKLSKLTIDNLKNEADKVRVQMERDEEISAGEILISPDQEVLSSGTVIISGNLVPYGVTKKIEFNVGFATQLSNT